MTTNQILSKTNAANITKAFDLNPNIPAFNIPRLSFYHANGKGTGTAVTFAVTPATSSCAGCLVILFAEQTSVGGIPNGNLPTFDYENAAMTVLDFTEVCQMLQVFRGETESINDGKGLYANTTDDPNGPSSSVTRLSHLIEPVCGYALEHDVRAPKSTDQTSFRIILSPAEALGLAEALTGAMKEIAFGR